jgi:hypothetical protein
MAMTMENRGSKLKISVKNNSSKSVSLDAMNADFAEELISKGTLKM